MKNSHTARLLDRVGWRLRLIGLGRQLMLATLVLAGVYAAALLVSRVTALIPDVFEPWTLALVPAAALLVALLLNRRPSREDTARLVDARAQTKDLFLTHALIETAPGDYRPLVLHEAEARAPRIAPAQVAPFQLWPRASFPVAALGLLAAMLLLPQWDPFRKEEQRQQQAKREEALRDTVKAVVARKEVLRDKELESELTEPVEQAVEELKRTLGEMKPTDQRGNLRQLGEEQKTLGEMWRQASDKRLKNLADQKGLPQTFGQAKNQKAEDWKKDLEAGKTEALSQELNDLKDLAERMAETSDPAQRDALKDEMAERLQNLSDFMKREASSPAMDAALKRAMEQLALSESPKLTADALEALQESLELSRMELEELAQSLRDLQTLEEALKTIQMAKKANELEPLDGEACGECEGLGDYAKLYEELMARAGAGGGMGGPGQGEGGVAPEDPNQEEGYNPEHAPTVMQPGKVLMEWKSKEVSNPGEAKREYEQAIRQVRQEASEAILREEVPPGYRDTIQKYFDTIAPAEAGAADESP